VTEEYARRVFSRLSGGDGVAFAEQGGSRFTFKHVGNTLYGDRGAPGEVLTGGMST